MAVTTTTIDHSQTSDVAQTQGKPCVLGDFITEADGWKIVAEAATWEGTVYSAIGAQSVKGVSGDCSGSTFKIYCAAGFPYPYKQTASFEEYARTSNRFRRIDSATTPLQAGDVLLWPGHMAIYAPLPADHPKFHTGVVRRGVPMPNNFYTAFNANSTRPYGPFNIQTFRADSYKVFRYLVMPGPSECK